MCSIEVSTKPAEEKLTLKFITVEKYNGNRGIKGSGHNAVKFFSQVKILHPADFFNASDFSIHKLLCVESLVGKSQTHKL